MLIMHEIAHKLDSYLLPDPGATEFDQLQHIADHQRQINASLRRYGLEPIRASDTDEQRIIKTMQAEEIRVIERMNEIRREHFPNLPLRDPTAHGIIDPDKVRFGTGDPGWETAENPDQTPAQQEERISVDQIRDFMKDLSAEDMQQIFGVDIEGFENFDMVYLWELANENVQDSVGMTSEEYRDQFEHQLGSILRDNPELGKEILDAYRDSLRQASYEVSPDAPITFALNDPQTLRAQLAMLDQDGVSALPPELHTFWQARDDETLLVTLMEETLPRMEEHALIEMASFEVPSNQLTMNEIDTNIQENTGLDNGFAPPPTMT